jgi:hypothetical protein
MFCESLNQNSYKCIKAFEQELCVGASFYYYCIFRIYRNLILYTLQLCLHMEASKLL